MTVTEIAAVHDENKSTVSRSVNRAKKTLQDLAKSAAADLIENQQRHIEALMKANDGLKDAIARRDKQIEDMKQGMAQLARAVAVKEEQRELHAMKNELCQYCGKYKQAHEGSCDGCKWRDM